MRSTTSGSASSTGSFEGLEGGLVQGLVASEPRTDRCQLKTRRCHTFSALRSSEDSPAP